MHQARPITSKPSVLLVDDDLELVGLIHDYLERDGFNVTCRHDGRSGVDAALTGLHF